MQEFTSVADLIAKIAQRRTAKTIILLSSGSLSEEIVKEITNPAKPLLRGKILDHLVFCGYYAKYEPWMPTNPLS